jgi:hypothetical protein
MDIQHEVVKMDPLFPPIDGPEKIDINRNKTKNKWLLGNIEDEKMIYSNSCMLSFRFKFAHIFSQ